MDVVTGGAGFIGSHLVGRLVAMGRTVRVVDDLSTGSMERLRQVAARIEFRRLDLATADLAPVVEGAERIFHLAAMPSVTRSVEDPLATHRATLTATLRLLIAAREARVDRVVLSSSSSVYGECAVSPKREDLPVAPISPYGVAKAATEWYARVFADLYGMRTVSLRYFNVFGPAQDPRSRYAAVIPIFITHALAGKPLPVFGDGEQTRDFTYVDNVLEANLAAADVAVRPGSVYNIAAGEAHSVLDLVRALERIMDRPLDANFERARPGDIRHSHADISRARADLGWSPSVPFAEGLRRTVDWYRRVGPRTG